MELRPASRVSGPCKNCRKVDEYRHSWTHRRITMRRTPLALILLAASLSILPSPVSAQGLSHGDELLKYCTDPAESFGRGVCHGYILGIASVLSEDNAIGGHKACIPRAVNMGQIVDTSVR